MTGEDDFRALYRTHRFQHQRTYYTRAWNEMRRAKDQLVSLQTLLASASAVLGVLAGLDFEGKGVILALTAIVPAATTALTAYDGLYAFDRHAKLYDDALQALGRIDEAEAGGGGAYVETVEAVLRNEQAQWGQLENELRLE